MFDTIQPAPPDAILGLTEAFKEDTRPNKINLGVGVYKDATGKTPVLATVKEAERRLIDAEATKSYKPIDGDPAYGAAVLDLGRVAGILEDHNVPFGHTSWAITVAPPLAGGAGLLFETAGSDTAGV